MMWEDAHQHPTSKGLGGGAESQPAGTTFIPQKSPEEKERSTANLGPCWNCREGRGRVGLVFLTWNKIIKSVKS